MSSSPPLDSLDQPLKPIRPPHPTDRQAGLNGNDENRVDSHLTPGSPVLADKPDLDDAGGASSTSSAGLEYRPDPPFEPSSRFESALAADSNPDGQSLVVDELPAPAPDDDMILRSVPGAAEPRLVLQFLDGSTSSSPVEPTAMASRDPNGGSRPQPANGSRSPPTSHQSTESQPGSDSSQETDPLLSLPPPPVLAQDALESAANRTDSGRISDPDLSDRPGSAAGPAGGQAGSGGRAGYPQLGDSYMGLLRRPAMVPLLDSRSGPYAFEYADSASFPEEVEEWFHYAPEEFQILEMAADVFMIHWSVFTESAPTGWVGAGADTRARFVTSLLARVSAGDDTIGPVTAADMAGKTDDVIDGLTMHDALFSLVYIFLGCWLETAVDPSGTEPASPTDGGNGRTGEQVWQRKYGRSIAHFEWIKSNTRLVLDLGGVEPVGRVAYAALDAGTGASAPELSEQRSRLRRKIWCALTLVYLFLEVVRVEEDSDIEARNRARLGQLEPSLPTKLLATIDAFRWKEFVDLPKTKVLLLAWKSILVSLGGLSDVGRLRRAFRDPIVDQADQRGQPVITASPLDYHQFRQEIGSKYPAYQPPPSAGFTLEPDQRSMLPPISPAPVKFTAGSSNQTADDNGASILHQTVHIATPAPSPPPSPGPSGKGFKKQNYQTNQLFPLLVPVAVGAAAEFPADFQAVDNGALSREWRGHVPLSILEGVQLFSSRVHVPRAMKQLWAEREAFVQFQRGWVGADLCRSERRKADRERQEAREWRRRRAAAAALDPPSSRDVLGEAGLGENLDRANRVDTGFLSDDEDDLFEETGTDSRSRDKSKDDEDGTHLDQDGRLRLVDQLYEENLGRWQSVVLVLLNVLHANANTPFSAAGLALSSPLAGSGAGLSQQTIDAIDAIRGQEIATKAVSGILILLLKWFKLSHVLKFEYITQLLIDANFLPLILRIIYIQDVEQLVRERFELSEFNFFSFCRRTANRPRRHDQARDEDSSRAEDGDVGRQTDEQEPKDDQPAGSSSDSHPAQACKEPLTDEPTETEEDSGAIADDDEYDETVPPPIRLQRPKPDFAAIQNLPVEMQSQFMLGTVEPEPVTLFSWRSFFVFINFLRVMQKVCKKKSHRELLMVTYKSSQFLGKTLRVNQRDMQLYALKLFKCQVPFCGRKWRQANMNVITAIYLRCRPELREEWLAGLDVDAEVNQAVPNEQSLRALTHWYNIRNYPDQMGLDETGASRAGSSVRPIEEEQDFFVRQLESMRWEVGGDGLAFHEHRKWAENVDDPNQ